MHFVYILKSQKVDRYYIGCTNNLEKRLKQHNNSENLSTKYFTPWTLIVFRKFKEKSDAYSCEKKIKSYKGGNAFKRVLNGEVAEWSKALLC